MHITKREENSMTIKWTGYDRIELDNGTVISVNSETPGSTSAHSKVVDAIIEAVGKIEGSDKPTCDAIADAGQVPCSKVAEADPELEGEPTVNQSAPMIESKPKLMIDIAKSTDSSKGTVRMISLTFRNLHEVFDRDEERAMRIVKCIDIYASPYPGVLVIPMNNDQMIMAEALTAHHPVGHDELVELAKQAIARVATVAGINYVVSVR